MFIYNKYNRMKYIFKLFLFLLWFNPLYSQGNITDKNILSIFYSYPLDDMKVTSNYGSRIHPITKKYKFHYGIDLKAKLSTPTYAVCNAVVVKKGYNSIAGYYVVLHDLLMKDVFYYYLHLSQINVNVKDVVQKGKQIGLTGNTGRTTGPHLHFGIKKGGVFIDPTLFLNSI